MSFPFDVFAQATPTAVAQKATTEPFSAEQLDALLAPIALYPDELLTQVLMAATFPLEVVTATRWVAQPAHKSLSGDALVKALEAEPWDPSVKSLAPFPVVLATMNENLVWLQQLGYAVATQQPDVFAAVQRLRRQAQANEKLQSSPQQIVSTELVTTELPPGSSEAPTQREVIVIKPAQPDVVYVPTYDPKTVYGTWPYPAYPPYYAPPPPGYYFGTALATGMAFAAGAAIIGGLSGWASPSWGGGYANVNVNRYNNINVNRTQVASSRWSANSAGARAGNFSRAPSGPVGLPGRSQVSVPGSAVRPPTRAGGVGGVGGAGGPGGVGGAGRPGGVAGVGGPGRPGGPGGVGGVGGVGGAGRPGEANVATQARAGGAQRSVGGSQRAGSAQRPSGAFGDMNSGRQARQQGQRGAGSRSAAQHRSGAGAGSRGGGGGGGGARGGRR